MAVNDARPRTSPTPSPRGPAPTDRIATLEAQLANERSRAEHAERALENGSIGGFGVRAERLLRLAETEAREMRASAAADVSNLLAKAQAEAEAHRHEVEQDLIGRSTELDRKAAERTAAVAAREQQMNNELESRREEGERLRTAALREADRIRRDAQSDATRMREAAEAEGRSLRAAAAAETDRLGAIQKRAHDELAKLDRKLAEALSTP
jgi:flagellar biosynthesis GTPase FlhF